MTKKGDQKFWGMKMGNIFLGKGEIGKILHGG